MIAELHDHSYSKSIHDIDENKSGEEPTQKSQYELKLEEMLKKREKKIQELKNKLRVEKQKTKRLKSKITTLNDIIKSLKDRKLITSNHEELLKSKFSDVAEELINRVKKVKKGKGRKYSPLLKSFVITLQFYSTKAYNFVRKTFSLALPHHRQIRKWYSKVPADPGFTEPSFRYKHNAYR